MINSKLVTQNGLIFQGYSHDWVKHSCFGEIVFNTSMVGYTEILTDPSYSGQIICFSYPMIGNYGIENKIFWESDNIHVSGIVVSELSNVCFRDNHTSLSLVCLEYNIPIIFGIDTRALIKTIREGGVVSGAIVIDDNIPTSYPNIDNLTLVKYVTTSHPIIIGKGHKKLIVVDCGIKLSILKYLKRYQWLKIKIVPFDYDYTNENYDGIIISNGPGNPLQCHATINILKKVIHQRIEIPIFGICLGFQIMGLAVGSKIYKLKFGHNAQNHSCLLEGTNKSYLTSQNHGYAIDENTLPIDWQVWFRHLNDNTLQGMKHSKLPYFSVQFHPEACPGPVDTLWILDFFVKKIKNF